MCVVWGDPHIITFDRHLERLRKHPLQEAPLRSSGWRADEVNVYDEGVYWLVNSPFVRVQGTYAKNQTFPDQTSLAGVAVGGPFLRNSTLIFRPLDEGGVTWNGLTILQALPSEFVNEFVYARYHKDSEMVRNGLRGPGVDVELPLGVRLTLNIWRHSVAVAIHMHQLPGGQDGHCGNFNRDTTDDIQDILLQRVGSALPVKESFF